MSSLSQLEKDKYPLIVNDIHMQKNSYAIHLLNMYALISPLQKVDYLQSMPEVYHSRLSADSKTLYKVGGDFFSIMNVSNPLNIYNIGSLRFPDGAGWNFTLSHDYQTAYMVDNMHGLTVIDISNTAEPQTVKVFSLGLTGSMVVSNDNKVLYVSGNREGLKILDVNNSTDPKLLKEYMFDHLGNTANVTSMAFTSDNSVLYVTTTGKGLVALDVSDPANPTEISNIEMSYPIEIVISHDDKIAYVLDEYDGINAIDISDKNNLKILSSITHDPANSITISHDSEKLFVSGINGGIRVYDIKNPSSPIILDDDTYIDGLSSPVNSTVSHDGTMLYLSGGSLSWMSVYSLGIHTDTIK